MLTPVQPETTSASRYAPTDGMSYNPNDSTYWQQEALDKELGRTFALCQACRSCVHACQAFPILFAALDIAAEGQPLPEARRHAILDACLQCKLCYVNCPYTEAEGHAFQLDMPRLLLRANAVRRRHHGLPLRERLLGHPDRLGKLGTLLPALANWANTWRPHRLLVERLLGLHRDKLLPRFARSTFATWFRQHTAGAEETATGTHPVVLFATCFTNYHKPALGQAAYTVLTHNQCRVACPALECCGMPALDGGDVARARQHARANVARLLPYVERGYQIAVINPTCSLMLKQEYPTLLDHRQHPQLVEGAHRVAAATHDVNAYVFALRQAGHFREDFRSTPHGPVAYHVPCHLRVQHSGCRGRDLLRRIPGVQPMLVAECSGHDGTWAMKQEHFAAALHHGQKAFDGMRATGAALWVSDCPLAALQFEQACGQTALHPMEVLARAYRADGFPQALPLPAPAESQDARQGENSR